MTVIALTSLRGAPGVTTLTVAAAAVWPSGRRVRVLEADPAGGVLATWYGLSETTGTSTLAASVRRQSRPQVLEEHSQTLPGDDVPVVVAPTSADHAASSVAVLARRASPMLGGDDPTDTLIDCGRLFAGSPARPLLDSADLVVVVTQPDAAALTGLRHARPGLTKAAVELRAVTVGAHPYGARESETFLDLPVSTVASDVRAAAAIAGRRSARSLPKSMLIRSVRTLLDELLAPSVVEQPAPSTVARSAVTP